MQSVRHLPRLAARRVNVSQFRLNSNISGGSMGRTWQDKERAAESTYFNKRDAELLAQLATKLHAQTTPTEQILTQERDALKALFTKHNVTAPDPLIDDVCSPPSPESTPSKA